MASRTQLEILIKTVADTTGIKLTTDQAQKLNTELQKTPGAAKPAETAVDALTKAEDTLEKTTEKATATTQKLNTELNKTPAATAPAKAAVEKAAKAKDTLSRSAQQASTSMAGLQRAAGGLAQGGFAGLVNVVGGLTTAFKGLAVGAMSAVLLPAITAVGAAILLMRNRAMEAEKAMNKMWQEAAKNAKLYDDTLSDLNKRAEESQERQIANLEEIGKRYGGLDRDTGRSDALFDREMEAQKREELAAATTPEERAAIEERYASAALATRRDRATRDSGNAERQIVDLRAQLVDAQAGRAEIERGVEDARAISRDAFAAANEATEALARAQEEFNAVNQRAAEGFTVTKEEMDAAAAALAEAKVKKEAADSRSLEAVKEAQAAADSAQETLAEADAVIERIREKMADVEYAAREAKTRLREVDSEQAAAASAAANAPATPSTSSPAGDAAAASLRSSSGAAAGALYEAQQKRAEEVAAQEADLKALEDRRFRLTNRNSPEAQALDREIAGRRSSIEAGNQSFAQEFDATARSIENDLRSSASALKQLASTSKQANAEVVAAATAQARDNEKTQRQLRNSREKSQP